MKIELEWEERQALCDILPDRIKEIRRGNISYGSTVDNEEMVEVLEGILKKVDNEK